VQHRIRRGRGNPRGLERADQDVHLARDDSEQKRIPEWDRQLVAHRRRALSGAVEEKVGHDRTERVGALTRSSCKS
jgi:hypothetical protein